MKVIYDLQDIKSEKKNRVTAIGVFDGVHRGHQAIINRAVKEAKKRNAESVVVTFKPHPQQVIGQEKNLPILTDLELKTELIEQLGVDILLVIEFTPEFAGISPEEFIDEVLIKELNSVCVVVGEKFRFGSKASGNVDFLKAYCQGRGIVVISVPLVKAEGKPVSSTRIRQLLSKGDFKGAMTMLGRYPRITGVVVKGHGRGGKVLGFPTANVETPDVASVPHRGVYAGWVIFAGGPRHLCVIDIGTSPTFDKESERMEIHIHIPDFNADLYGKQVELEIHEKIRKEKIFGSTQALTEQIRSDIKTAKGRLLPQ